MSKSGEPKGKVKPLDIMSRSGGDKRESKTFGHNVQKWRSKKGKKPLDIMSRSGGDKRESKTFGHCVQK